MAVKKIILANTLYQLLAKFVSTISTVIVSVIITRLLGANTWGEYSIVVSYISLFYIFTEFGINSIAAREFSFLKDITTKHFYSVFRLRLLVTLIVSAISLIGLYFLNYSMLVKVAILFGQFGLIMYSLASSFNSLFQARLSYKYLFYSTTVYSVVNLAVFLFILRFFSGNVLILLIPIAVAEVCRFFVSLYFSKKILTSNSLENVSKSFAKNIFYMSIPLAMVLILNTLMVQIDRLMLSVMVAPVFLGFYSLSYKLFDVLLVFPTFFMNSAFPVFANKYKLKKSYNAEFTKSLLFLVLIALFATFVSIVLAPFLIPLIWGSQMYPAVPSFIILISGSVFFYISSLYSWSFVVENKQKVLIYIYLLGFLVNFGLNLLVIPRYSYVGAAYTTVFTEMVVVLLLVIFTNKKLNVHLTKVSLKKLWKL